MKTAENYRKCGESHPSRKCKAYGNECYKCKTFNHFTKCRGSKNVKTDKANLVLSSKQEWNYSSDESTNSKHVSKRGRKMTAPVANGKVQSNLEFQLDTAVICNMLTRRDYAIAGKPRLIESTKAMTLYDDSRVVPDGWCTMTVTDNSNNKHQLNVLMMNTKQHSLLSLNTCIDLSLIKMNESVHVVSEDPLENILM